MSYTWEDLTWQARVSVQQCHGEEKQFPDTSGWWLGQWRSGWLQTHHHGLLNQGVTVLTHVLQNLVSCIVPGCCSRLGSHCQGVDEGLKQTQRNIYQETCERNLMCVLKEVGQRSSKNDINIM
jgi:hypothetical protein